ncbi:MEDS domain-containing protein [Micromonospora coxensis]|uniref:MEDS: MEthanogen/methylotroph, DcmR Sensory domain n=1 Tax=Micromonospora coxensis TaxID=356852 RepID=A0A1C5H4P9_9ACTN|nr:MEDS domain-containing protein [Micromonospora coxensis]SCG40990.1 MEDS: MEthanogen/methylotroph, DcmR Sensory domain [Micromonospora coxensis]
MTSGATASGRPGHACWSYDDPAIFEARAREFLLAGLAAGDRVCYVSPEPVPLVVERWSSTPRLREALHSGAAEIASAEHMYGDGILAHDAQLASYTTTIEAALADGYAGWRIAADATSLVSDPQRREAFARYEHLVDRFMRTRQMSAVCGYDRSRLGGPVIEELACLHPTSDPGASLFHLYAGDGGLVLDGELDSSNQDVFATALRRTDSGTPGDLLIDAADLRFVDYRSLVHLHRHAARRHGEVVLRTDLGPASRLVALLGLTRVRVEAAG